MTLVQWSAGAMVVICGLFTGVILTFQVERVNLWARMPIEQYAVDFRRSLFRVDPMQPILGVLACLAGGYFAWTAPETPRLLAWWGVGLILVVIVGSILIAEPINTKFRRLAEGQVPAGADGYRVSWRRFHAARTLVALAALACVSAAAVIKV